MKAIYLYALIFRISQDVAILQGTYLPVELSKLPTDVDKHLSWDSDSDINTFQLSTSFVPPLELTSTWASIQKSSFIEQL